MTTVIGVRFKTSGRIYYFDPTGFTIEENDGVIVETARGTEFGEVAQPPHEVEDDQVSHLPEEDRTAPARHEARRCGIRLQWQ